MVSEIAAVCVVLPLLALMEKLRLPVRADELTLMVATEVPAPGAAMDDGLKVTVTPEGKLVAESETAALNDPAMVVVTLVVPLLPLLTVTAFGEAETAKLGGTVTVRLTVVVCVRPPPVPVTVMV
jgi:hypothetical protein